MTLPFSPKALGIFAGIGLCVAVVGSQAESLVDFQFNSGSDSAEQAESPGLLRDKRGSDVFADYVSTDLDRKQPVATQVVLVSDRNDGTATELQVELFETTLFAVANALVRTGPGTDFPAVTKMVPGQSARVTGKVQQQNWYQVALTNGGRGYIHGSLLEKRPPAGASQRLAKVVPLPPTGQGTAEQERKRADVIRKVQSVNQQFEKERQVLAAMQQRMKRKQTENDIAQLAGNRVVEAQSVELSTAASQATEESQRFRILAYYEENTDQLRDQLTDYNKRFRLSVPDDSHDVAVKRINTFNVEDVEGEHAQVRMSFDVGADGAGGNRTETATYSFTMRWNGESLDLLSHSTN